MAAQRRGPAPVQPCKLCGSTALIEWSHIVPAWVYRRVIAGTTAGVPPVPVHVGGGVAILNQQQSAAYLLCGPCERLVGEYDGYISRVALQEDGSFPALSLITPSGVQTGTIYNLAHAGRLDVALVSKFAVSVIWRASVSGLYSKTSLGPYESAFRDYVLGRSQLPRQVMVVAHLVSAGDWLAGTVMPPDTSHEGAFRSHRYYAFGMDMQVFVGSSIPNEYRAFCFVDRQAVIISQGQDLREYLLRAGEGVTPKGSLARLRRRLR